MAADAELMKESMAVGRALSAPIEKEGMLPFSILRNDYKVENLEHLLERPTHIKETVTVYDVPSFVTYYNDFHDANSRIFFDPRGNGKVPGLCAILDYHQTKGADDLPDARWNHHKLRYGFRPTRQWEAWGVLDRKDQAQADFARFLEDNLLDIVDPTGGEMLQIATTFQAKKDVDFSSAVHLDNGTVQFKYAETISGGSTKAGDFVVPAVFTIAIPPFEGAAPYKINVRFRYKIGEKGLVLRYELINPQKYVEDAANEVVAKIEANLVHAVVLRGSTGGV
jgi:uncharacterized protein YfdQ (DUF2303 family)